MTAREPGDYPPEVRRKVDYEERRAGLMRSLRRMCIVSVLHEVAGDPKHDGVEVSGEMLRRVVDWGGDFGEVITLDELSAAVAGHDRLVRERRAKEEA